MTEKTVFEQPPKRINWVAITNLAGVIAILIVALFIYNALQSPSNVVDNTFDMPPQTISPQAAHEHIQHNDNAVLLEISATQRAGPYIEGAIPLLAEDIAHQAGDVLPDHNTAILLMCFANEAAACGTVANWLRQNGYRNVMMVDGGLEAWQAAHLPLVEPPIRAD
ncbi:MAG: rhodanese-like domain-containing protein [Anaerolineales bacterium]